MHALFKHPSVDGDIQEAALWYFPHDPAVAVRLVDEVQIAIRSAAEAPLRYSVQFAHVRRVRLHRFPHSVFFTVSRDSVLILAVLHGARAVESLVQGRALRG